MDKAPMRPSRRLIIAALIIVLINFAMMIALAHLHWFGRLIALVGMIFVGLAIFVRKDAARYTDLVRSSSSRSLSSFRSCSSCRGPATTPTATSGTVGYC